LKQEVSRTKLLKYLLVIKWQLTGFYLILADKGKSGSMRRYFSCLFCLLLLNRGGAQVLPKEGSEVNYRIIGFSVPTKSDAQDYYLQVANGHYRFVDSFSRNIIFSTHARKNKTIAEVPSFGTEYTWRISYCVNGKDTIYGELHHFRTGESDFTDSTKTRMRIMKHSQKYSADYVFLDCAKALYDMNGKPVWYLPEAMGYETEPIDLKNTNFGTITFICNEQIFEVNYNGDTLWSGPDDGKVNGEKREHYHHEFTRLESGNYMALGMQYVPSETRDQAAMTNNRAGNANQDTPKPQLFFGTLAEYDAKGNLVWSWKASEHFMNSEYVNDKSYSENNAVLHENSFYFDERNRAIYISCKDLGMIVKVKYPEGNVLACYGHQIHNGIAPVENGMFCGQHSVRETQEGYLSVYNNRGCGPARVLPSVVLLEEPKGKGNVKKIWEYICTADGLDIGDVLTRHVENLKGKPLSGGQTVGGGAMELPDRSVFVAMGGPFCKLLIVSREKKELWSALPEKWDADEKKWKAYGRYRASVISRADLEQLIWTAEK